MQGTHTHGDVVWSRDETLPDGVFLWQLVSTLNFVWGLGLGYCAVCVYLPSLVAILVCILVSSRLGAHLAVLCALLSHVVVYVYAGRVHAPYSPLGLSSGIDIA